MPPAIAATLLPPVTDQAALRERVRRLAENRPAVYRMIDPAGRVLYVGKAKSLRTRLLGYFRAQYPKDKPARILHATHDLVWDYVPSEFASLLSELRQIQQYRPPYNVQHNRTRRATFIAVSGGAAPRVGTTTRADREGVRAYGPLRSPARVGEALRVLNDLLGLRDCADRMPMVFAGQGDLFDRPQQAACHRHGLGLCDGPCAGFVEEMAYRFKIETAVAFLEGRTIQPLDRVVEQLSVCTEEGRFETAIRWRERFEALEWLFAALNRARSGIEFLSFVYREPGVQGDERAFLIRRGRVRATFPYPSTPIEIEAFRAVVREELDRPEPGTGPLPPAHIDEMMLIMSWFRKHPDALRRTTALETWAEPSSSPLEPPCAPPMLSSLP